MSRGKWLSTAEPWREHPPRFYSLRLQNAYDTLEAKRRIAAQVARVKPYKREKAGLVPQLGEVSAARAREMAPAPLRRSYYNKILEAANICCDYAQIALREQNRGSAASSKARGHPAVPSCPCRIKRRHLTKSFGLASIARRDREQWTWVRMPSAGSKTFVLINSLIIRNGLEADSISIFTCISARLIVAKCHDRI